MKQTIEEAANKELLHNYAMDLGNRFVYDSDAMLNMFRKGAQWRESQIPEHISTVQDCELAVRETKEKAIEAMKKVLENRVHISQFINILLEFKELINK